MRGLLIEQKHEERREDDLESDRDQDARRADDPDQGIAFDPSERQAVPIEEPVCRNCQPAQHQQAAADEASLQIEQRPHDSERCVGKRQLLLDCDRLSESPEAHRLDADDGQRTGEDKRMLREGDRADPDIGEEQNKLGDPAQRGKRKAGIKEQAFGAKQKIEAQAAPAITPAPQMRRPAAAVKMQHRWHFCDAQMADG